MNKNDTVQEEKHALRRLLRAHRRELTPSAVITKSAAIMERCLVLPAVTRAEVLVLYAADENEVVTEALWLAAARQGKTVYYPRISADRATLEFVRRRPGDVLVPGTFGILVPPGEELLRGLHPGDVVLTPGVGFDAHGHRLGRGKGYYDRAFRGVLARAVRVAPAYELQIVPAIPSGPTDEQVQWIVTEERVIVCP